MRLAPNRPTAHVTLGTALAVDGRRLEAGQAFRAALRIDPQHAPAHNELARLSAQNRNPFAAGHLAAAASGFAATIRIDPREQAGRDNLDRVLRVFLVRASYFLLALSYVTTRLADDRPGAARLLALVAVAGPVAYAGRFLSRLDPGLRAYLTDVVSTARMRIVLACTGTALTVLLGAAALPSAVTWKCTVAAAIAAIVGRVVLHFEVKDQLLSTFTLALIALLSGLVTAFLLAVTITTGNVVGALLSAALGVLSALCVRTLVRRSR
ncbi:hypothetical protein KOI35_46685 [Actinoplanes bogorensis]|uniref:Tetratricopeptide repeat protein n=1 Tax=Paractinoplanes bogorensis TaxID=1610840 RepID=A0ABS5Z5N7_9ACTN|nr:hypothetical protein [Actinoplanes bogorensis]MBU2671009.1 hypothetical protein [Actinoplanes bogorensis]